MMQFQTHRTPRRILAVIVLYKSTVEESVSVSSLLSASLRAPAGELDLLVMLHDNTPGAVRPSQLPPNVVYVQDDSNSGLAAAYNRAIATAMEQGYEWLLTLDQDTGLPPDSLRILLNITAELEARPDVAAVVPQIRASGRVVSPNYFAAGAWPRWFPAGYTGIPDEAVYAFNSASLVRISALRQIGGYSPWFWLDNSDSFLYRQLAKFGKRVYVAGVLQVDHDFSMLNLQTRVSPERYSNILLAESAFWDLEMNTLAGLERTARLAARLVRQWRRHDRADLRRLTWNALRQRLFHSRRYRIATWRRATEARFGAALHAPAIPAASTVAVSVCMAAYNGERYIEAQLRSILPQLKPNDELVIVDDRSRDGTVDRIRAIQAELRNTPAGPRILLVEHSQNQGVVQTFEDAIRSASGDILFLCDDDDLWAPDKVQRVLQVFAAHPETQVVSTGVALIDEHDQPLANTDYLRFRKFTANLAANLLHNQYQGSAMAFRSTLIRQILPFPRGRLFLHDAWIGTRNTLTGGGTAYIAEPLLLYRRHTGNYSRRFSRARQIWLRVQFLAAHLRRAFHRN
jgi:glycosyltransferase involved in cell wall biosynthesis